MAKYWKASLLCTACFWGVLALAVPLRGNLSFGFFVVCWLSYYASGGVLAFRAASAFQREWLRLFPDQGTRYDDVRWGNAKDNFYPAPCSARAGFRQMGRDAGQSRQNGGNCADCAGRAVQLAADPIPFCRVRRYCPLFASAAGAISE